MSTIVLCMGDIVITGALSHRLLTDGSTGNNWDLGKMHDTMIMPGWKFTLE